MLLVAAINYRACLEQPLLPTAPLLYGRVGHQHLYDRIWIGNTGRSGWSKVA